jgi:hypothetical protein
MQRDVSIQCKAVVNIFSPVIHAITKIKVMLHDSMNLIHVAVSHVMYDIIYM